MAFATGTATDHDDLWSKLITFLTSNADLVSAGEAWEIVWTHGSGQQAGVVLKGPGLSDEDEVYIGLRGIKRVSDDESEIQLIGMTGVIPSATSITGHVNCTPHVVRMFTDSNTMSHWLVANGRRFAVVLKISTVFETMYGGLILPYAMPDQYSYPLFIGGSAGETDATDVSSWRSTSVYHRHFPHSHYDTAPGIHHGSAWLLSPQGDWLSCGVFGDPTNVAIAPRKFFGGFGLSVNGDTTHFGHEALRWRMRSCFGGDLLLTPFTLVQESPSDQTYGVLDGCFHVTGFGNSSQNLVTVGGVDHLTVQDVFRTGEGDYWALALA